jgi:flavin reductase (DIM6/NTAB) family NADH-FMN oxidoreductase RutF
MTTHAAEVATSAQRFRTVMAQVPTAVSVVTTPADGTPHGTTVSAFMSLSMDPPTLLVSLASTSSFLARISIGSPVGVNVLSDQQAELAIQLARKDKDMRELAASWEVSDGRPARIPGCLAWMSFTVTELIPAGDHTLVTGTVIEAESGSGAPMVYWRRTYGTHTAAPA